MLPKKPTTIPAIPEITQLHWQKIIDLACATLDAPLSLLLSVTTAGIEVIALNKWQNTFYAKGKIFPRDSGLYSETVIKQRQELYINDAVASQEWEKSPDFKNGMMSYFGLPLIWPNGEIFGILCAMDQKPQKYTPTQQILLREFKHSIETDLELLYTSLEYERVHEMLEMERQQLISLSESIEASINIVDPETYDILYINPVCKKEFGDIVGKKCYKAFHDLDNACPFCTNPLIFNENLGRTHTWEYQNKLTQRWYHCIDKAIRWLDGEMVRCEIAIDITENKSYEQTLKIKDYAISSSLTGIAIGEFSGKITYANQACLKMWGYEDERDILGKNFSEFFQNQNRVMEAMEILQQKGVWRSEGSGKRKDGTSFDLETIANAVFDHENNPVCIVASFADITGRKTAETAIKTERDLAQKYFDIAGTILIVLGADKKVSRINKKGCQILGYEEKDIVGKDWFSNFIPEKMREQVTDVFDQILSGKIALAEYFENTILTKNGQERLIAWHNTALFDNSGKITATLSSGEDITDQRAIQENLRESEEKYRHICENSIDGISMIQDGKIIYINPAFCQMLGYAKEELLEESIFKIAVPGAQDIIKEKMASALTGEMAPYHFELTGVRKDNTKIIIEIASSGLINYRGRPAILAIFRDMTSRILAEKEIKESREKFKALFDFAPDAVFLETLDGKIVDCNIAAEKMLGYTRQEMLLMSASDVVPEETMQQFGPLVISLNTTGVYFGEAYNKKKNGQVIPVEISAKTISLENQKYVLVIIRDVSSRKEAEAELFQAQKLASIGQLAAGIAHEINNPLSALSGEVQWMLEKSHTPDFKKSLELMQRVSNRIAAIVKDLLVFSREIATSERQLSNIEELIQRTLSLTERRCDERKITIIKNFLGSLRPAWINNGEIEQVFINILLNSIDAMPSGGELTITTTNEKTFIAIVFKDTGSGIAPQNLLKVFDPFFTTKPPGQGTGLGLSLSHGIIKKHGGKISLESQLDKGTTVTIYLPADQS